MNRARVRKLGTLVLTGLLCVSFALPVFARHHHYYYDNGNGGMFRTTHKYADHFAAYLGIVGGAIPVFDATIFSANIKILDEFKKITQSIQDLFGLRKERLATTLDIEVERLARIKMPETAEDKEAQRPGVLLSGETVIDPEVDPEDTVIAMRVDHFDALAIPTDIGYGLSLHRTKAMDDHMAVTRSTMQGMENANNQILDIGAIQTEGIAGAAQQGIVLSNLTGGIDKAIVYNRMADMALDEVEYGTGRILRETGDKHWNGLMTFRVIDPFNPSAGEKKLLEENKEKIRTKNLGWKKF